MKFFHLRTPNKNRGGITVGYERVELPDSGEKLLLSFARCSEKDVWNRKRSIMICRGRFAKGKFIEVARPAKSDIYDILTREAKLYEEGIQKRRERLGIKHNAVI